MRILFIVLLLISFSVKAENTPEYTSLLYKLRQKNCDTGIINQALSVGFQLKNDEYYDSAFELVNKTLLHSKRLQYKTGEAKSLYLEALLWFGKGEIDKGISSIAQSRLTYEDLNDTIGIINCYIESGVIYFIQKKYDDALREFDLSYHLIKRTHLTKREGQNRYLSGLCYLELGQFTNAEICLKEAEKIYSSNKQYIFNLYECYTGLAELYYQKKNYPVALKYFNDCYTYFNQEKEYTGLAINTLGIANIYYKQNKIQEAKKYYIEAYRYSELSKELYKRDEIAQSLADIYASENDFKNAYKFYTIYHAIHDSLYSRENYKAISLLQSKLNMAKKEYENELLKKQQKSKDDLIVAQSSLILVSITASILLLLFAIYAYLQYRKKKKVNLELIQLYDDISKLSKELDEKNKLLEFDNEKKNITIQDKEQRIIDFAFYNAHVLRAEIARILGLVTVFKELQYNEEEFNKMLEMIDISTNELDKIVKEFGSKLINIEKH